MVESRILVDTSISHMERDKYVVLENLENHKHYHRKGYKSRIVSKSVLLDSGVVGNVRLGARHPRGVILHLH